MPADEKNEGACVEPSAEEAEGQGPKEPTQPSTPHAGGDALRIGTKEEIRAAGGGSPLRPLNVLRDGTK